MRARSFLALAALAWAPAPPDPLPSWNEGPAKKSILEFVARVTKEGSPDFVPIPERIATFDNDGTLWSEQPDYVEALFALDRLRELAPQHPEWRENSLFKTVLAGEKMGALAGSDDPEISVVAATHAGLTTAEFDDAVKTWMAKTKCPRFGRRYDERLFQPMLEVLAFLRANGFKTFIVSGAGVEFIRAWAEKAYGIPPEQVVGTSMKTRLETRNGKPELMRLPEIDFVDDGPGKPVGIGKFIGRRPVMAFGNSDGDLEMLQWTTGGAGARFGLIVHHTDAEREWAYDRKSHVGRLDKALDEAKPRGWTVVDMKSDWKRIFPFEKP